MDPRPSGLKRNTFDCASNYKDTGTPLRPGMIFHFIIHCLPLMMESHHQSMSRLIAKWHYQQEKGLMWKERDEGILNG